MKLKEVMKEKNISQSAISRMANINQSQFNRAFNGYQLFFPAWRKRIAIALNMSEEELFPEYSKKEVDVCVECAK